MPMDNRYLTSEDVVIINKALSKGEDVRVQATATGYRIISEKVTVLKKKAAQKR